MLSFALLLAHAALPQEPAAAPQQSMGLISLRPFISPQAQPEIPLFGTMLPHSTQALDSVDLLHPWTERQWSPDDLGEVLQEWHLEATDNGLLTVDVTGDSMLVQAEDALLAEVTSDIEAVLAILGQPIEVTASIFALDGAMPTDTILHADQLRELELSSKRLWHNVTTTRSSVRTSFDSLRWSRYVRHTEVSVAQDSSIAVPVDDVLAEGVRIAVLPHSMINSEDIVIQAQFSIGELHSLENTSTGAQGHPNIDLPQIATAFGAVGARVPSGSGMAVELSGLDACGSRILLVVSPRYPTPRGADTVGKMLVAPVSALSNQSLTSGVQLGASKPPTSDSDDEPYRVIDGEDIAAIAFSNDGPLEEILINALGESDAISCSMHTGGYLFLAAPAHLREQAKSVLEALQNRMVRNVGVRCSVTAHQVASASTLASETPDGTSMALHEVALPCLAGRTSILFRGIEQNAIQTLECEIAQETSILSPTVDRQSSGLWVIACPSSEKDGIDCDMTLQFTYQNPIERRALTPSGMLMLNQSSTVRAQPRQRFTEQPLEVASGATLTLDGRFWRPHLMVACK